MNILFVSTSIPPCTDMQTTRNIYLIKALIEGGNKVDILTCGQDNNNNPEFINSLNKSVVWRTELPSFLKWHYAINKSANKYFKKIHNVLVNFIAIPDLYKGWNKLAFKLIKDNNLFGYDMIITSSGSYTAHIVGRDWKKITGKKWIAEYGDPWGINGYGKVKHLNHILEDSIMRFCDGFTFTTHETIDAYKNYMRSEAKYCLIPCGYSGILYDIEKKVNSDNISFLYSGTAFKRDRDLSYAIKTIGNSRNARFTLVGTLSGDFKTLAQKYENIDIISRVSYETSLQMIQNADVLIHIGNYGSLQVPGKTYIYLATQKPILYIQQELGHDPTLQVLKKFKGVVFCKNNLNSINSAISYIKNNYKEIKMEAIERSNSKSLQEYSWKNIGKKFNEFIEEV